MAGIRHFLLEDDRGPCAYLPDREATMEHFIVDTVTPDLLDSYLALGFRHFSTYFFRPRCEHCGACVPWRIPLNLYEESRNGRRAIRKLATLDRKFQRNQASSEFFDIYTEHKTRFESDGVESYDQFSRSFFGEETTRRELTFREHGRLVSCGHADVTTRSMSAVYTYFDPAHARLGLGTATVYQYLRHGKSLHRDHLYLGYFIAENRHMRYKQRFRPAEVLTNNGSWRSVSSHEDPAHIRWVASRPVRALFGQG